VSILKSLRQIEQERADTKRYSTGNVMFDTSKLCLIYARQSTSKQFVNNIYSAMEQRDGLLERATDLGWTQEKWILYVENQLSKKTQVSGSLRINQRTGLRALTEVIESGQASAVLVVSVDRITRDEDLITPTAFANLCKQHHVIIITDEYTFDFNNPMRDDMGRFMNEAIAAKEYVRKQIKGKMLKGRSKKASMGRVANGACPVGLMLDASETEKTKWGYNYIASPHADRVDWLYARYRALGANLTALHKEIFAMAQRGEPLFPDVPGIELPLIQLKRMTGGWTVASPHGLKWILTNPAYAGHFAWEGRIVKFNAFPPIVDPSNWLFAFEHISPIDLEGNPIERGPRTVRYEQQGTKNTALLAGVRHDGRPVIDGRNGQHVYVRLAEVRDFGGYLLRNQSESKKTLWGYVAQMNVDKLDAIVEDRLLYWLRIFQEQCEHPERTCNEAALLAAHAIGATSQPVSTSLQNDLALTVTEIGRVERAIRTSADVMSDEDLRAAYEKKARLLRRRAELEREIASEEARTSEMERARAKMPTAAHRWKGWGLEERRQFIRLITDSIILEKQPNGDLRLTLAWSDLMGFIWSPTGASGVKAADVAVIHRQRNLPARVTWTHDFLIEGQYYVHGEYSNDGSRS
jgi:DNA invertase Pin-like site-specific DNA recombinase